MKGFGRRLFIYMIGFGLGCVLVWVMFYKDGNRASWMPEGRVLEFLADVEVEISDELKCELACKNIPETFLDSTFWANAKVDFKKSVKDRKPCPEHCIVSTTKEGVEVEAYIENCEICIDCKDEADATLRSIVNLADKEKVCDC